MQYIHNTTASCCEDGLLMLIRCCLCTALRAAAMMGTQTSDTSYVQTFSGKRASMEILQAKSSGAVLLIQKCHTKSACSMNPHQHYPFLSNQS